jgi:hypothetical protein
MYIKQAAADRPPLECSQPIDVSKTPYSGFGRPSPSSDRFSTSRGRAASMHQLRTAPDTTSRLSGNATAVTWSETQISPGATAASRIRNRDYRHHASSTPEPIRKSLESTGIFRDTGIKRTQRPVSSRAESGPATESLIRKENDKRPIFLEDPATTRLGQIITQYDPSLGCYQQQESSRLEKTSAASPVNVESLRESKIAPLSREQIAKNARVKLPAATIPVEAIPEEPALLDGKKAAPSQQKVSEEIIANSAIINTSPVKYILQPASVKPSDTAAPSEVLHQSLFENSQVTQDGSGAQTSSRMESDILHQDFSSKIPPPQSGQRLHGMSREEVPVPVSGHDTSRLGPVLEATTMTGLPVRGPSRDNLGQYHRPLRLSPEVGLAPLYLNQIQRQFSPEQPLFKNSAGNEQADNNHSVFNPEMVRYLADNEYNMLEEEHHKVRGYSEYLVDGNQKHFEYRAGHNVTEPQMWQLIAQDDEMMEHYETWRGLEPDISNDCLVDGNYFNQGFAETYGVEQQGTVLENQLAEEVPMTGFWRPNRPF